MTPTNEIPEIVSGTTASGETREPGCVSPVPAGGSLPGRSMPFAEYQVIDAVNWSSLKHMAKSPKHYLCEKAPPPYETAAMIKGRAGHTAVLEPDLFPLEYAVFTGARRAGKEWDAFVTGNGDRTILKESEYRQALAIRDAVRAHPVAGPLLTGGRAEQVIEWMDPETSLRCKGRIDYLRPDALIDLKTTANLDPRRFSMTALDMAYHGQLAFYLRGLKVLGMEPERIHLIAGESVEPYDVAAFVVDDGALAMGDALVSTLLNALAECQATNTWPGRYPTEATLFLPGWAYVEDAGEPGDLGLTITNNEEDAA